MQSDLELLVVTAHMAPKAESLVGNKDDSLKETSRRVAEIIRSTTLANKAIDGSTKMEGLQPVGRDQEASPNGRCPDPKLQQA